MLEYIQNLYGNDIKRDSALYPKMGEYAFQCFKLHVWFMLLLIPLNQSTSDHDE